MAHKITIKQGDRNLFNVTTIASVTIHEYDDEYDVKETFRKHANNLISEGWKIIWITNLWSYTFEKEGEIIHLYMFEQD